MSAACFHLFTSTRVLALAGALLALACDANSDSQPVTRYGSVSITSSADDSLAFKPFAYFYRAADQTDTATCNVSIDNGSCRLWTCDAAIYTEGSKLTTVSAGDVSVTTPSDSMQFNRDDDGYYRHAQTPPSFWSGGDSVHLDVSGSSDFPALTVSLTAPPQIEVTKPEVPSDGLTLDPTSDLEVGWSGAGTNSVFAAVSPETTDSADGSPIVTPWIDCEFNTDGSMATGSAVVPATLLKEIPAATIARFHLDVLTVGYGNTQEKDAWVEFRATWAGLSTPLAVPVSATNP